MVTRRSEFATGASSATLPLVSCLLVLLVAGNTCRQPQAAEAAAATGQPASEQNNAAEKSADLSSLINETLKIQNKSPPQQQPPRDDWTFERVEHDLLDFLQELNARYQKSGSAEQASQSADNTNLSARDGPLTCEHAQATSSVDAATSSGRSSAAATTRTEAPTLPPSPATRSPASGASTQQLPVSLATGDLMVDSESKWQYGIFDRFTRARASTKAEAHHNVGSTTPEPLLSAAASANFDVRSFNSDECGLRTYLSDEPADSQLASVGGQSASFFPHSDADLMPLAGGPSLLGAQHQEAAASQGEARKELNQRRQRPTLALLGSGAGNANKQQQSQSSLGQPLAAPSEEEVGGGAQAGDQSSAASDDKLAAVEELEQNQQAVGGGGGGGTDELASEFNLNSRRQWLQQQLGNTLQMLGFNMSQTATEWPAKAMSMRENMMKMSNQQQQQQLKVSRALSSTPLSNSSDEAQLVRQLDELRARQDELKLEARVIGGTDARLGDSPWSVSLQALVSRPGTGSVEYRHYCGGTIISEYYILTAAHCLDFMVGRESRLFVVMGDLNWRMSTSSMYGKRYAIERLIIHSGYKSTAFGHDIGLIKTREPIKPVRINGRYIINSVCLPERNMEHSGEAELVGWGLFSNRNEMADSLQIADVPILPRPLCVDLYRRRTGLIQWLIGIELITDKQICAGTFGRGICQGDSGSALVFNEKVSRQSTSLGPNGRASNTRVKSNAARDQQSRATIIGVVAFGGIRRCSYQSLPGVYMQTSKYLDWILPRISA